METQQFFHRIVQGLLQKQHLLSWNQITWERKQIHIWTTIAIPYVHHLFLLYNRMYAYDNIYNIIIYIYQYSHRKRTCNPIILPGLVRKTKVALHFLPTKNAKAPATGAVRWWTSTSSGKMRRTMEPSNGSDGAPGKTPGRLRASVNY